MTSPSATYHSKERMLHSAADRVMGTRLDIVLLGVDEKGGKAVAAECLATARRLEESISRFIPTSDVARINRSEPQSMVAVGPGLREIMESAARYCRLTLGAFDITLGEGSRFNFSADGGLLVIPSGGLKIDMGGYGKGLALNMMHERLKAAGITDAFVSFGGSSILGMGRHPGGNCWRVSIADPFTGHTLRSVDLSDSSLSVSGNSREYRGHIVDPSTGRAVTGKRLSAVVAPSALDAEVLSTAWLVADADTRSRILPNFEIIEEYVYN